MTTYEIRTETNKITLKQRLAAAVMFSVAFFVLRFGWSALSPTGAERIRGLGSTVVVIALMSFFFGFLMAMAYRPPHYKLLVDQDSITGVWQSAGWMRMTIRRVVRKGEVRTIFEMKSILGRPGGIGVSERTQFGARMWGFVYIPKDLPKFDDLKAMAQSWRYSK